MKNLFIFCLLCSLNLSVTCNKVPHTNDCIGEKQPGMMCMEVYQPVCGCDGKTYPNECYARREGIKKWTNGACQ